ncbi:hypothetical protein BS78_06G274000 [Paspalum vaginatum]|nr:hypothetical protein BS78_06G274000 [Paspalum vaginatum]
MLRSRGATRPSPCPLDSLTGPLFPRTPPPVLSLRAVSLCPASLFGFGRQERAGDQPRAPLLVAGCRAPSHALQPSCQ